MTDPELRRYFEPSNLPRGEAEVEMPAYVIEATGQVVRQGRLRRPTAEQGATSHQQVEAEMASGTAFQSLSGDGARSEDSDPGGIDPALAAVETSVEELPVEGEDETGETFDRPVKEQIDKGNDGEKQ